MGKFAFIFHPHDIESFSDGFEEPLLKKRNRRFVERALRWFPPFKRETVTGIKSLTGATAEGEMILLPLIPEQILNMDEEFVIQRLIKAGKLAEDLGAKIVGLGAYAAWIARRGVVLSQALDIAVTTGTSYTVFVAVEAILKAAEEVGIELSRAKVAVLGATGSIGRVMSHLLVNYVPQITLIARNETKLQVLAKSIYNYNNSVKINICSEVKKGIKGADMILVVTNTPTAIIDVADLPVGSVVCDISLPHNISQKKAQLRQDVLVIDGGVVRPPGDVDFHFTFGLPKGLAYACMAETMILALENKYENFSLGGNVSVQKVLEIGQLGVQHGFKLAKFRSFGREVDEKRIEAVRRIRMRQDR